MPDEKQEQQYFNIDVAGDYFTPGENGNSVKFFGPLTVKMVTWQNCQSLAMHHLMPALLAKADPTFARIRRCVVLGVKTMHGKFVMGLPIKFMSREQIAVECRDQGYPIVVDMYPDITKLRSKLHFARKDPDKFKEKEHRAVQAFHKIGNAIDLNKDVFDSITKANAASDNVNLLNKDMTGDAFGATEGTGAAMPAAPSTQSVAQLKEQVHADENKTVVATADLPAVTVSGGGGNDLEDGNGDFDL